MRLPALALGILAIAGCIAEPQPDGYVEGKVTIGPLCPTSPCIVTSDKMKLVYAARKLIVYRGNGLYMGEYKLNDDGTYRISLKPGRYYILVKPDPAGGEMRTEFYVESGKTTELNLSVDTGIR